MKTRRHLKLIGALTLVSLALTAGRAWAAEVRIDLRNSVNVAGDYLRLGDVATVDGDEVAVRRAKGIFLGSTPKSGTESTYTRAQLIRRLRAHGFASRQLVMSGAEAVSVSRSKQVAKVATPQKDAPAASAVAGSKEMLAAAVNEAVFAFVKKALGGADARIRVTVGRLDRTDGLSLEKAASLVVLKAPAGNRVSGRMRFTFDVRNAAGASLGSFAAQVTCEVEAKAVVARRSVRRGGMVGVDDIAIAFVPWRDASSACVSLADVAGKRATRALREGTAVGRGDVERPALVLRNQAVRVVAKAGGMLVTHQAKALDSGGLGAQIRVRNLSSGADYIARVTGPGMCELAMPRTELAAIE